MNVIKLKCSGEEKIKQLKYNKLHMHTHEHLYILLHVGCEWLRELTNEATT